MQNGTKAGRPIYREMRKSSDSHYESKTGAVIMYCESEGAWVFAHDRIRKSLGTDEVSELTKHHIFIILYGSQLFLDVKSDCPWLLRSPDTDAFNLLEVSGEWSIWVGSIKKDGFMSATCNGCKDNTGEDSKSEY